MPKLHLGKYYRVVVTGDRHWPNEGYHTIKERLELLPENTLVITGGARGVDTQADLCAHLLGFKTKVIKAEWDKYGKRAGPIRNIRMLEEFKPHLVIVFHNDLEESKGTIHCLKTARSRSIETEVISMLTIKGRR